MNWRKTAFRLHGWLGLNLGLLLFVVCLSGTFATISGELDLLVDPRHRLGGPAPDADDGVDWDAMHAALVEAFPDGEITGINLPGASGIVPELRGTAAVSFVRQPDGQTRKAYLNPYTGELRGHTSFFNVQRFFRTFHRRLFDGARGILIVTMLGFVLFASAASGFLFYKGWRKHLVSLPVRGSRRRRWSDLHKTAGIWGLLFAAVIGATGVFYFVEILYQGAGRYDMLLPPPLPSVETSELHRFGPNPGLLPISRYVAAAERAYPELSVRSVRLPATPRTPVHVDGQAGNPFTRDRADHVLLHPFTGTVIGVQRTEDIGVVPFVTDAVDPVHFGYVGGTPTKVLWFSLGLLMSFSILSGMYIWILRSVEGGRAPSRWMRGAPLAVAVTLLYLLVVTLGTAKGIRGYAPPAGPPVPIGHLTLGPYAVRVECADPCLAGGGKALALRFLGTGLPNYANAELRGADDEPAALTGPSWRPRALLKHTEGQKITLRIEAWDGAVYEAGFVPSTPTSGPGKPAGWPDTAPGVWGVVFGFGALLIGALSVWLALVRRVARRSGARW